MKKHSYSTSNVFALLCVPLSTLILWISEGKVLAPQKLSKRLDIWNAGDIDLENNSNDLALNITSFQEMNHKLVKDYFQIINRCLKPKSYFMCVNRWSKATDFWLYPFKIFKNSKTILFDEDLTSRHSSMNKIIVKKLIQLEDNN